MTRYSKQRETILEILNSTKLHPKAAVIYEQARKVIPNISLGTVYRNLAKLQMDGKIISLKTLDGSERFDSCCSVHPHLHCKECGEVLDLDIPFVEQFVEEAANFTECEFDGQNLMFYGKCKNCKNIKNI